MNKYDEIKKHNYNWQRYWYKRGEEISIENKLKKVQKNKYKLYNDNIDTFNYKCH